ncbi:putative lipopotein protein [Agrobacterium tumefaciens str. Cherry 2E-2-2]|nr:putative lipopotein protein [Agrobacterium tumefaciens str. Cherry 2E-2-2]
MNKIKFGAVGLVFLTSCSTLPKHSDSEGVSVEDVVYNVRCELRDAVKAAPFLTNDTYGWTAGADLSLQVVASADGSVDAATSTPLKPGTFVPSIGFKHSGKADRTVSVGFKENLKALKPVACAQGARVSQPRLHGELGIRQWVASLQAAANATDISPEKAGYILEFTVETSGNLGPSFKVLPLGTSSLDIGAKLTGSRKNVNRLVIAFTKNPAPAKAAGGAAPKVLSPLNIERNDIQLNNLLLQKSLER